MNIEDWEGPSLRKRAIEKALGAKRGACHRRAFLWSILVLCFVRRGVRALAVERAIRNSGKAGLR